MDFERGLIERALASGPKDSALASAGGALGTAASGGSALQSADAALDAARGDLADKRSNLGKFACGAAREAIEHTPLFGPIFRLGEAAIGSRMCEDKAMSSSDRKNLVMEAVADAVAPGSSYAVAALEVGASRDLAPVLDSFSAGTTQTTAYKAYAYVFGNAISAPAPAPDSAPEASPAATVPAESSRAPSASPGPGDAPEALAAPLPSEIAIGAKLAARRAMPTGPLVDGDPGAPSTDIAEATPEAAAPNSIAGKLAARRAAPPRPALAGMAM